MQHPIHDNKNRRSFKKIPLSHLSPLQKQPVRKRGHEQWLHTLYSASHCSDSAGLK